MSAEAVLVALRARGLTIATAESCTGGLISGALTEIPGSSDVFGFGYVTYSNEAKIKLLGVSPQTLAEVGAVSEEVAGQMAEGARSGAGADIALSVTGIAGPGGSDVKPEGRVCFGLATTEGLRTQTQDFGALGRSAVRAATLRHGLALVLAEITAKPLT